MNIYNLESNKQQQFCFNSSMRVNKKPTTKTFFCFLVVATY